MKVEGKSRKINLWNIQEESSSKSLSISVPLVLLAFPPVTPPTIPPTIDEKPILFELLLALPIELALPEVFTSFKKN